MQMQKLKNNNSGFTILEVVIAVAVLTIGILAMGVLQTSSVKLNSNAKGITEASTWAMDTMENIMALEYMDDDINAGNYSTASSNKILYANHPSIAEGYAVTYTVADDGPVVDGDVTYKTVTVTVTWSDLGTFGVQRNISLNFIKPRLI
jgi:type IV pilus assembly protein PilV